MQISVIDVMEHAFPTPSHRQGIFGATQVCSHGCTDQHQDVSDEGVDVGGLREVDFKLRKVGQRRVDSAKSTTTGIFKHPNNKIDAETPLVFIYIMSLWYQKFHKCPLRKKKKYCNCKKTLRHAQVWWENELLPKAETSIWNKKSCRLLLKF